MKNLSTEHTSATLLEAGKLDTVFDPEIKPLFKGARISAPAFVVQGVGGDNLALHNAVLAAPAGHVLVADLGGRPHGHWGEVLAVAAQARGLVGLVIDGAVRDSIEQEQLGFPVFSRGVAIKGTAKAFPGVLGGSTRVGGVLVRTGDLIVADADGIVLIPTERVEEVIRSADARVSQEEAIFNDLRGGANTLDIYGLNPAGSLS